ncbi:sulfotransferase family 2 domain-containing protein [Dinoroseobacter sp. S124A]|uniref:sulfotransferase family 2 domain-containing protein n=1 Tax=Dinoroseobacter sp. S124A TaxID=3415128 RepID=UPI003C7D832F
MSAPTGDPGASPRLLRHARGQLVTLSKNGPHVTAATQALVHYPTGAVYSFIPKNACSTLRYSLALANGCIAGPEDWAWIHPNNGTFRASLRELVTAPYTFVVLRCPYARLASVFLDKIVGRYPDFWGLHRITGDRLDPEKTTFRQFVTTLAKYKALTKNIHWQPQSDFLVYERYDDVFALEQFASAIETLAARGIAVADARPLTKHGTSHLTPEDGAFADAPIHRLASLKRQGKVPAHRALYDEALVARVARLYAEDIDLYARWCRAEDMLFLPAAG